MVNEKPEIRISEGEQFHFEFIMHNGVIKLTEDETSVTIGKTPQVSRELANELAVYHSEKKVSFIDISQKVFDELVRDLGNTALKEGASLTGKDNRDDLAKLASDAPIVNMVNDIILQAVHREASDIHFEAADSFFRVRMRIDGYLETAGTYPKNLYDAVVARLKVISKLDITQRRLAQDGKALLTVHGNNIDIRTSTVPTVFGESVVLRLLGVEKGLLSLSELGMNTREQEMLSGILNRSHGSFILTGPTGSGKTTTLRALLSLLDHEHKNIITIEDPVEYTIPGINQIQINERIGFGFSTILRNILRQDPDIIMVGEMRDRETADLALRSAMTGHLVFSTLHTNDSVASISRLLNIGIEPYIIESSLTACAAQRLLRKLCPHCKKKAEKISKADRLLFDKYGIEVKALYEPVGCSKCRKSGFSGRTAVFELFMLDETVRDMIVRRVSLAEIRTHLVKNGFTPLLREALAKTADGVFHLEEVKGVAGGSA